MDLALLIDFGSTFTKLVAVDLDAEEMVARVQSPSTVETDITVGLRRALTDLRGQLGRGAEAFKVRLAASSAAGGLRMVVVGLVPELTVEAAKRAALGAGAKVLRVYAHELTATEIGEIEDLHPDVLLLAGGTDGGNRAVILYNAAALSSSRLKAPVVVAGNKVVQEEVEALLRSGGKEVVVTANVMPEVGRLQVEPARHVIREIFMQRIVQAKGIAAAGEFVDQFFIPTPLAVLNAAKLLAEGAEGEPGLGELMVVDVGGATTDVHSVATGNPHQPVVVKGLEEPYAKRTVEGDLGVRINAPSILEAAGRERMAQGVKGRHLDVERAVSRLAAETARLPQCAEEWEIDAALAQAAVEIATDRHVGRLEVFYTPAGAVLVQYGKDLTRLPTVIGTGGVFSFGKEPRRVLLGSLSRQERPELLKPQTPRLFIDEPYVLFAMGLLAEVAPGAALRLMRKHLREV